MWVTPLVGRHVVNELKVVQDVERRVVNELKVGCHVVIELKNILSRTLSGSFTCVYTRDLKAVEYLAKLSRILKIFSKSFKAIILGFNFI